MTEPERVTCARCGETGTLTETNDYYTTHLINGTGRVCERCLLTLGGLDPDKPLREIPGEAALLEAAVMLAEERGFASIFDLMLLREAINSRRLDGGDGETHSV